MRELLEPFLDAAAARLAEQGVDVVRVPICRVRSEFDAAVRTIEEADADAIVTLHLAYSPSLESANALTATPLPVIMMDTTLDADFSQATDPDRLTYNHGIHGVQDLASMLGRLGKPYRVVAGHFEHSDVAARVAGLCRAAQAARLFRSARVLRVGPSFTGMGDFKVSEAVLRRRFGIEVRQVSRGDLEAHAADVSETQIQAEMARDAEVFDLEVESAVLHRSERVCLGLRRLLEEERATAFSQNFLAFDTAEGPACTVPFLECSRGMARGIGYAGEGDVLTAALVGALARGFGQTTFTEIFCPDWTGGTLFLSHMGEVNPDLAAARPLVFEKPFAYTGAHNPASLACALKPGAAVLVNLTPRPNDTFRLIVAPVESLGDGTHPDLKHCVRGWIRPAGDLAGFLERYSTLGGTHHSALVYGVGLEPLREFAAQIGVEYAEV
jgi:L-arabinose isomerase